MFVYNLEKLSPDGYKQLATDITHARLYYDDFTGTNFIQGTFLNGSTSIIQFDETGVAFTLFKMFTSTDGVNYTERESFGGDVGTTLISASMILDPNDYSEALPYPKMTVIDGVKVFAPSAGGTGTVVGTGVDYLFCRGRLVQHNSLRSGKAYFGAYSINSDTGVYEFPSTLFPEMTIADSYSVSKSGKISTGFYAVQFVTDNGFGSLNGFLTSISGALGTSYRWENLVYPIWKKATPTYVYYPPQGYDPEFYQWENIITNEFVGTLVICPNEEQTAVSGTSGAGLAEGVMYLKTYDADGVLADNILTAGITVEFRVFPNLGLITT